MDIFRQWFHKWKMKKQIRKMMRLSAEYAMLKLAFEGTGDDRLVGLCNDPAHPIDVKEK